MKRDFKSIKALIIKNEYFYNKGSITQKEYSANCLLFANKIDTILKDSERLCMKTFFEDEFSLAKFNLSISILKAVPN